MALVIFFCSCDYDLDAVAAEMRSRFENVQVVGCTTAGEIGPAGYREHSIVGASLPADGFSVATGRLDRLQEFGIERGQTFAQQLLQKLESQAPEATVDNSFALLLIDGLSVREEPVTRALQHALGSLALIGGSAGDGLRFGNTYVYHDGRFHSDSAVLTLVSTPLLFKPFFTQHFVASAQRVVVTEADTARRLVLEIDGRPAAEAYAELVGVDTDDLDPMRFASSPMVVTIGGQQYVRSISNALPDGSLQFFCAIDEGMVLRVGHGTDLVGNLDQAFAAVRGEIGEPQLVIGCDCILRRIEVQQNGLVDQVGDIMGRNNAIGFGSYGEQYHGMHVNQTFTGIAIGHHGSETAEG
ncbi:MAG: FIST C-terminal domain-containing protein [Gammaproteobacteria bacterium]|nr:FIST C-terminal domain-containing protein [Gammaproteobacteria bacterium]MBU1416763.1 FIST C-terminal domain-containing protein [Gammaproteobacteria bacterium]